MFRCWKIFLTLMAVVLLALGTLPWWLGAALHPILLRQGITFEHYERIGYTHFRLRGSQYSHPGLVIDAADLQADTPLLWLNKRFHGEKPLITVEHWVLRHTQTPADPSAKKGLSGMADLQRLLIRLVGPLDHWLPHVQLRAGELHGITPEMTLAQADWSNSSLRTEGVRLAGRELAIMIAAAPENTFAVTAYTPDQESHLQFTWSAEEMNGTGAWREQPVQLIARYSSEGWLPVEASAVAEHWEIPAARFKLGTPYAKVQGESRAQWRDGNFDLSLQAKAEPVAGNKAPPFEVQAAAHGNPRELTLGVLKVNTPFASASLSAPVTFSLDHAPDASTAELTVKADLAKLPWIDAHGSVKGSVTVAGNTIAARQTFQLELNDVVIESLALKKAQLRGVLEWPRLNLDTIEVQLDKTSFIHARGAVNWQTREVSGGTLDAKVGPDWFAHWLPQDASWSIAEVTATMEGPLDALRHHGSLKLSQLQWKPLEPVKADASWEGTGTNIDIRTLKAVAANSALQLSGTLNPQGLQLRSFSFAPHGQVTWQLASPAQLTWAQTWQIDNFHLAGSASEITFKGKGGTDGFIDLKATAFESAWLHDFIMVGGPHWQLHTLEARGRVADGVLAFDTALTAQIEMQPRPAEVKLRASGDAHGLHLRELTVVESDRVLTQAQGQFPFSWKVSPALQLSIDENGPLEFSAFTDPDSPLWSALAAYTGLKMTKPTAKIELKGSLREPVGELKIQAAQLGAAAGRFKFSLPDFEDLTLVLQLGRKSVALPELTTKLDGQAVQASGRMPMDDDRWQQLWRNPAGFDWTTTTARVEIPDADLAVLGNHLPNFVASKGRLRAKVELAPGGKLSGELHLTDAASRPLPPFSTLQEINADLVLHDRILTVQKLSAKLGGEPVVVDGSITLVPGGAPRLALGLKGKNLPLVRNTGLLVRNDIDLQANTDAAGITRVSGLVTLRDCLVLANFGALLPSGQRGVTRQPPYFAVDTEPFRSWPLAVDVRGPRAVRIRTPVFNGLVSAHFQLGGTLGEPRAVGELTVDEASVLFPFATFRVQAGTVRLRESDPFHAVINLNAVSQRRDYQLRLEATGQLPSPHVVLSSTPALDAEAVLLMVMTGQPPNSDSTISSAGQRLALLGAYLGRGVFQDLGIGGEDRLEISAGEQVSQQGRETYDFEYKLDKRWSLTGEYDRFDSYNAGLKWRVFTEESKPLEKK